MTNTYNAESAEPSTGPLSSDTRSQLLVIPSPVAEIAIASVGAYFGKINGINPEVLGLDHVNPERYLRNIEVLDRFAPLAGKKLLEIGCGFGVSLALMLKRFDADAYGVEPASVGFDASFNCARAILSANNLDSNRVINAIGEQLPFPDATFDIIYSNNVLEHTSSPAMVLREAVRVLKPGGKLFIEVPNYLSYFEGHYLVPQPPIFWNGLLAAWVRWVYHRDPAFVRTLRTEINPIWCRKVMHQINQTYAVQLHSLGEASFLARLGKPFVFQTEAVRGNAQKAIQLIQKVNVGNWIGKLIVGLQGHYPIILVATRASE